MGYLQNLSGSKVRKLLAQRKIDVAATQKANLAHPTYNIQQHSDYLIEDAIRSRNTARMATGAGVGLAGGVAYGLTGRKNG